MQEQTAYLIRNGRVVLSTPISTGPYGHLTENDAFKIIEKELNHFSNRCGKIVDARGNTIVPDSDADMSVQSRSTTFRGRNPFVDPRFDPYFDRPFAPSVWWP